MIKDLKSKNIILYVEDDEDDQQLIKDSLQHYTHNVEIIIHNNGIAILVSK